MSAFDKIIGYQAEKAELMRLCDMLRNRERYQALGAKLPRGLLIHGEPGLGKSLMARCFMEEVGWRSYTVRRTQPDGDFIRELHRVFQKASEHAPAIILLDDMDKFVVEDKSKEEYVAVQAEIDEVADKEVYVIATANDLDDIPDSLLRAGRFDRKIEIHCPDGEDAAKIIDFYLRAKSLGGTVNSSDVARMLGNSSCAELETALNEAAIHAGYERSEQIEMRHIVKAVLQEEYDVVSGTAGADDLFRRQVAYHEAGHAAMLELLSEGGVGLVYVGANSGGPGGATRTCGQSIGPVGHILVSLSGYVATGLKYGMKDAGGTEDLRKAYSQVNRMIKNQGMYGMNLVEIPYRCSDQLMSAQEIVTAAEMERYLTVARRILIENRTFLDAVAEELYEKGVLLNSDISRIRGESQVHCPDLTLLR